MSTNAPSITLAMCPQWGTNSPPISIGYLSAFLEQEGVEVYQLDFNIAYYNAIEQADRCLWEQNDHRFISLVPFNDLWSKYTHLAEIFLETIISAPTRIVGFSINSRNKLFTLKIIEELKKRDPERIVVAGGFAVRIDDTHKLYLDGGIIVDDRVDYDYYQPLLDNVDYYIVGEGEFPLLAICRHFCRSNEPFKAQEGVYFRGMNLSEFVPQSREIPVQEMPYPLYDEYDFSQYPDPLVPVLTARGCLNHCSFCTDSSLWRTYRFRDPDSVIQELDDHCRRGRSKIIFNDLCLNANMRSLRRILDGILERNLNIAWAGNFSIASGLIDPIIAKKIKKSGCNRMSFGVESGSDNVLKKMGKRFRRENVAPLLKLLAAEGLEIDINIIVGFPGEEEEDFLQTLALLDEIHPYLVKLQNLNTMKITPTSPIEKNPFNYGITLNHDNHVTGWTSKGNNEIVRKERLARTIAFCQRIGLGITWIRP